MDDDTYDMEFSSTSTKKAPYIYLRMFKNVFFDMCHILMKERERCKIYFNPYHILHFLY